MAPPPPGLPTWKILPSADGGYRWVPVPPLSAFPPPQTPDPPALRLPSFSDLLLQAEKELIGCSAVVARDVGGVDLGDAIPAPRGSARRREEGVGEENDVDGLVSIFAKGPGEGGGAPMFTTGSGRSVKINPSSIQKAASVLGCKDGAIELRGIGNAVPEAGSGRGGGGRDGGAGAPMFQTGSGRSVTVRKSSMEKAAALLGGGEGVDIGDSKLSYARVTRPVDSSLPMFHTGSGKAVTVQQSSIMKAASVLEEDTGNRVPRRTTDVGCMLSSSFFQTGSGKTVSISPDCLRNAAAMLGLEESHNTMAAFSSELKNRHHGLPDLSSKTINVPLNDYGIVESCDQKSSAFQGNRHSTQNRSSGMNHQISRQADLQPSSSSLPQVKFQTASGRSLLVSHDSLQRARNLLGDSDFGPLRSDGSMENCFPKTEKEIDNSIMNTDHSFFMKPKISEHQIKPKICTSLDKEQSISSFVSMNVRGATNSTFEEGKLASDRIWRPNSGERPPRKLLGEITNIVAASAPSEKNFIKRKNGIGRGASASPFKKPRTSRFTTPLKNSSSVLQINDHPASKDLSHKPKLSSHYPPQFAKKSLKDFLGKPPRYHGLDFSMEINTMTPDKAEKHEFTTTGGSGTIGIETITDMLLQSGASLSNLTKEWVSNHYKWIVWKLACLERCYPAQASGKYLTFRNVLAELKYRYEREMNYGHRSAVKKIFDGDASPASLVVLCISAILSCYDTRTSKIDDKSSPCKGAGNSGQPEGAGTNVTKIELTDGWYSLCAILDAALSRHLLSGKLFIGQKLRIWGAGICGWAGPVSPLNTSKTVSLLLHINGTYRAHWADKLGFCKDAGLPLSFKCIKGDGGLVPKTLVGVTRVYPLLYKERFSNGGSIVRSERMEMKAVHLFSQRRANISEDIMSEESEYFESDNDCEGAKIFKIIQNTAEPEMLMAGMSSEQLNLFSAYQSKQETFRQSFLLKRIEKAFEEAGLHKRDVSPFMRVRVTGLTCKGSSRKHCRKEGLITIWNPTEKHRMELLEGQIYTVSGLVPLTAASDIIYLQARGSATIWRSFPHKELFEPFFSPRKAVLLSNLGEVPLASEFDIAAFVVCVGDVYDNGHQKRQWVFVTDSSIKDRGLDLSAHLLAINFSSSIYGEDLTPLISHNLSGCVVGFYNIIKRPRDQANDLWVSDANESSIYTLHQSMPNSCHLKEAADTVNQWAKESTLAIQRLKDKVSCIIAG